MQLGVSISGRGSNLDAILTVPVAGGSLQAQVAVMVLNRAGAPGLERAQPAGFRSATLCPGAPPDGGGVL